MKPRIEDIAGQLTELKSRRGRDLWGLCPLHDEKTPSFHVDPEKQAWHCFGCGEGGDVIALVQKAKGLSFTEACKWLRMEPEQNKARPINFDEKIAWRYTISICLGDRMRRIWQDVCVVESDPWFKKAHELINPMRREYLILAGWQDSLWTPEGLEEMYENREIIERIVL